jgi:hypothetical protein
MASFGTSSKPGNLVNPRRKTVEEEGSMETTTRKKIFVTIQGGVGEVDEETVPEGVEVEILNFDVLASDPNAEIPWWSQELKEYWLENHKSWGRCEADCPCRSSAHIREQGLDRFGI